MTDKLLRLLGMSKKAGGIRIGFIGSKCEIEKKRAKVVLISSDISQNSKEEVLKLCNKHNIEVVKLEFSKTTLGQIFGREIATVMAITNESFYKGIAKILSDGGNVN